MCEFCQEHGEGKLWYLEMEHYSKVLMDAELSAREKDIMGAATRGEWVDGYMINLGIPAIGIPLPEKDEPKEDSAAAAEAMHKESSEEELLAQRKFKHFGQVVPIEDAEKIIDRVSSITRFPCACRYFVGGMANQRYCFGFAIDTQGLLGKFPDASTSLEVLEKEEAKKMFRQFDDEGLIHSVWTSGTPYILSLCNCDGDCAVYQEQYKRGGRARFFRAEYVLDVDWDRCTGCKSCMSQCQFGAIFFSAANSKVQIEPTRCFGCGLCRAACPTDAISMLSRHAVPEAAELWV